MSIITKDQWYIELVDELEQFYKKVDENIDKKHQQIKACIKNTATENKLAQEMKKYNELCERQAEVSRREAVMDRLSVVFETGLTIGDGDQTKLDNAKDSYKLAKELTGIRLHLSSLPNTVKGYIKSESRKLLQPFEFDLSADNCSEALWALIQTTAVPVWPFPTDKESRPNN